MEVLICYAVKFTILNLKKTCTLGGSIDPKVAATRQAALEELKPVTSPRNLKFLINNTQLFNMSEPACRA